MIFSKICYLSRHLLLIIIILTSAFSQEEMRDTQNRFEFLPAGLHFSPLRANVQEPRIGVFKYFGTANLKVDIGNTIDVFGYSIPSPSLRFTAGIDFMAYAFVTGAQGLRLQIDALDGFFGGNITVSKQEDESRLLLRLRILHLSAHMVDGHYSLRAKQWIDNREPIPFTKDFGELVVANVIENASTTVRYYGGISYATLVRPVELERFAFLVGIELSNSEILGSVLSHDASPFIANHFTVSGNPVFTGNNQTQIGIKFGSWNGKGVVLYLAYYTGNSFFSEYFDERVQIVGAGFTVDFP